MHKLCKLDMKHCNVFQYVHRSIYAPSLCKLYRFVTSKYKLHNCTCIWLHAMPEFCSNFSSGCNMQVLLCPQQAHSLQLAALLLPDESVWTSVRHEGCNPDSPR